MRTFDFRIECPFGLDNEYPMVLWERQTTGGERFTENSVCYLKKGIRYGGMVTVFRFSWNPDFSRGYDYE